MLASSRNQQQGATLIVCMIILVVITFLGVGSIQDTTMEEKMASNMKNRNAAFQAAESAQRAAETYINSLVTTSSFDGTGGLLGEDDDEPDYYSDAVWASSATSSKEASGVDLAGVATKPRYIIKYVVENDIDPNAGLSVDGYGEKLAGATVTIFKITSRGTGNTDNAKVVLQTNYGKRF